MQQNTSPMRIVIVGGGTSGWMTAAALSKMLRGKYPITLVESDDIGTIGVGEATIPMIQLFNRMVELDEDDFMRKTQATFKLGIEFVNWGKVGDRYIHGFGTIGQDTWTVDFHQYWLKRYLAGKAKGLEAYSINTMACLKNKFMRPKLDMPKSPLSQIAYAFHFDAALYARYLRDFSEKNQVKRIEGRITEVHKNADGSRVTGLALQSGEKIEGDFFIDCSGMRALLIEGAMQAGFEDWQHWLPCDRAAAVPCASAPVLIPYTRATARDAGWQWRIPLQHRIGNGHVYSSRYISDDEAVGTLLANLDGQPLADPRMIKFVPGRRREAWKGNVLSIGLAAGFLEPLESTSIHLVQVGIAHLLTFFPSAGFQQAEIAEYNRVLQREYEWVRDFIILHYKATERDDTPFWNYCRTMEVPESLTQRMELFRNHGRVFREGNELFTKVSWLQVMHGQRIEPQSYHPLADVLPDAEIDKYLDEVSGVIDACADYMPTHAQFIADHCAAGKM